MFTTDCPFLENELLDVARLFKSRPQSVEHAFRYENGVFQNDFIIDGAPFSFSNQAFVQDELHFKRLERRFAKLALYQILSKKYGESTPWGALTGIRPTKLAYMEQEEGRDFHALFEQMQVRADNVALVEKILRTQAGIYEKKDENTAYFVSLPFCPTKCAYCSFITAPIDKTRHFLPEYLTCLEKEISASKDQIKRLRSTYIGGGTPFALDTPELERVLKALIPLNPAEKEYTVEAGRPDVFSEEKLQLLKTYGVNRICINPQTFSDETLRAIGRKHTVKDFYHAYEMSEKYGFSVNIDLIAGLEGETVESFQKGIEQACALGADNITVHCLCLKSGAKLKEETCFLENGLVSDMVACSRELLSIASYLPYYMYRQKYQVGNNENVGWTKKGKACVYNIDVMEETASNFAVGSNAVSKRVYNSLNRIERFDSTKDLKTYIEKIDEIIEKKRKFFE